MINLLKNLLGLGKKKEKEVSLAEELQRINGIGPEFAERLVRVYQNRKALKGAKDLEVWLPDNIANNVYEYFRYN